MRRQTNINNNKRTQTKTTSRNQKIQKKRYNRHKDLRTTKNQNDKKKNQTDQYD